MEYYFNADKLQDILLFSQTKKKMITSSIHPSHLPQILNIITHYRHLEHRKHCESKL